MAIIALANPTYKPAMRGILAIARTNPIIVATTLDGVTPGDHGYIDGLIVRLDIPPGFGMFQADGLFGPITVTGPRTFNLQVDSTNFDAFVTPVAFPYSQQFAQVVPFGELNSQLTGATTNVL